MKLKNMEMGKIFMLFSSSKKGFTLAEVLVTLVVIGIVAALSIPALLQNTNQAELKTAFKKSLAVLNQALTMNVAQNSIDAKTCCSTTSDLVNFFGNKLNVISSDAANSSFYTADGMQYTFNQRGSQTCGDNDTTDWTSANANCTVLVDVNGSKFPNAQSDGLGSAVIYRDQYYMIIKENSVVPGNNTTNDAAVQALEN